jgi:hypothetical protein
MVPINVLTSTAAPLPLPNIDTDQIIPKQFLKRIERTGYEDFLFYDWRYTFDAQGKTTPNPDFVLNKPEYKGAKILLAEKNFGCGSSRCGHLLFERGQEWDHSLPLERRRGRDIDPAQHREPRTQDHNQPRRADSNRRVGLQRAL